jgi:uncharacterized protein
MSGNPRVDFQALRPGADYAARLQAGEVAFQHCERCGESVFFPRVLCPSCGSTRLSWRHSEGAGTVYSATTVHPRDQDPYTVGLIDLDDGVRVMTSIDDAQPDVPPIGRRVVVSVAELNGQPALRASLQAAKVNRG